MSDFEHFVCWQRDRTYMVLNPEAEHVDDDVFVATHTDVPLAMLEGTPDARVGRTTRHWSMEFDEFLEQFLAPNRPHLQVAVLGNAGSGKSHFIHWLALNIPPQADRHVLLIPRTGISLRGIIQQIIEILPAERQHEYQDRLDHTGFHLATREVQRSRLLAEIALAIEADQADDEIEDFLRAGLPLLFRDPNYAVNLQKDGGIADELIAHIVDPGRYERRDQRRSFSASDLPLEAVDIAQLAADTRTFMAEMRGNPDLAGPAIAVVNRNLDRAIGNVLNFTGDQLIDLMRELRRYLRGAGKSLVLLIEDFARLQGVDYALLQALIESAAADEELCELRWAMAMTTGYYQRTADTIRTRMNYVIDMDLPTRGSDAVFDEEAILGFASRYLNATRLTAPQLRDWRREDGMDDGGDPPSACTPCPYRPRCHAAFGELAGVGLYPFNRQAILTMTSRVDPELGERFNPRLLIKDVLAEVLGNRMPEFDQNQFPSERFLAVMGGTTLLPVPRERLERESPEHAGRQAAVLELWGVPGQLSDVHPGIYEAFGLPVPDLGISPGAGPIPPRPPSGPSPSPRLEPLVEAARAWGGGAVLAEKMARDLRDLLFGVLVGYVDWDGAGIQQSWAASRSSQTPFRARSIVFRNQETTPAPMRVMLEIPSTTGTTDLRQTAIGIEGLLEFQRSGEWASEDAELKLIALRRALERWATDVVGQLQRLVAPAKGVDRVDDAIALLAIGVAMAGGLEDYSVASLSSAIFEPWPAESAGSSSAWQRVYRDLHAQWDLLVSYTRGWASGGKGGQVGAFVDGSRIARVLDRVAVTWRLNGLEADSSEGRNEQDPLDRLLLRTSRDLARAAEDEQRVVTSWLKEVRAHASEVISGAALQTSLRDLRQAASAAGLPISKAVESEFDAAFEGFAPDLFDRVIGHCTQIANSSDPTIVMPLLAATRIRQPMASISRMLAAADRYLTQVEAAVATREGDMTRRSGDLPGEYERVHHALNRLIGQLGELGEATDG